MVTTQTRSTQQLKQQKRTHVLRLGFRTTGLDITPQMMARAQAKACGTGIRFIAADAEETMEPPESHDVIVARYLFWTLSDPEAALADWLRVLKPGGTLLLIDGDHVTPPPLGWLAPWFDRILGRDPKAGHALVTPAQWDAHRAIVAQLPFREGLRSSTLLALLEQAGFQQVQADNRGLQAFRPLGWRQRLLSLGRHRFVVSARKATVQG